MTPFVAALPLAVPGLALLATALCRRPKAVYSVAWAALLALWLLALAVLLRPPVGWDGLARWYNLLVLVLGGLSLAVSIQYIATERAQGAITDAAVRRYFLWFEAFIGCLLAVGCLTNYLGIWAAVEGTTLTSILLVAFDGGPHPLEAAWKYLVVTGIGGLLALIGTVLTLHGAHLSAGAWTLATPVRAAAPADRVAVELGFILALVGFGSKAGLVPFHTWLPDAHSEAPAPVSAALSGIKLVGGLYALLRMAAVATRAIGPAWPHTLLIITGILSLGIAAAAVPGQRDLKRMFAYSSIEHMGVIALGAGFGGIGLLGALLHMWTHGFGKSALFYGAGNVRLRYGATGGTGVRGIIADMPLSGSALVLGAIAIVGLPPFGLFWSEWLVLLGGVQSHHVVWVCVALVFLVVNFLGFGLRLPRLLLGPRAAGAATAEPGGAIWPLAAAVAGVLVVGLALPGAWHGTWVAAARVLGGGA